MDEIREAYRFWFSHHTEHGLDCLAFPRGLEIVALLVPHGLLRPNDRFKCLGVLLPPVQNRLDDIAQPIEAIAQCSDYIPPTAYRLPPAAQSGPLVRSLRAWRSAMIRFPFEPRSLRYKSVRYSPQRRMCPIT